VSGKGVFADNALETLVNSRPVQLMELRRHGDATSDLERTFELFVRDSRRTSEPNAVLTSASQRFFDALATLSATEHLACQNPCVFEALELRVVAVGLKHGDSGFNRTLFRAEGFRQRSKLVTALQLFHVTLAVGTAKRRPAAALAVTARS
jgi:hypothetical protein